MNNCSCEALGHNVIEICDMFWCHTCDSKPKQKQIPAIPQKSCKSLRHKIGEICDCEWCFDCNNYPHCQ